jgi:uncharacterized protein (TIGR00159 family)
MNPFGLFKELGFSGFLDITVMSFLIYMTLVWFKRTRAAFVLTGILIASGVYLAARELNLQLTAAVFHAFFAVILIAVVVIFQEELRHLFEQVAIWSLERSRTPLRRRDPRLSRAEVEVLVRTLADLARQRTGAILVVRGRDALVRHLEGGIDLGGQMSEPLLHSIFDPHSPGHDGAVVIEGNRVTQFGCHLPLSKNLSKLRYAGTRHSAALGLSELTDALCLVVSEERGVISVAREGDLREVESPERLAEILEAFYRDVVPRGTAERPWREVFQRNYREKITAVVLASALWFVFVHESVIVYRSYNVPVRWIGLDRRLAVKEARPERIHVTVSGPRRSFYFLGEKKMRLRLKLYDAQVGSRRVAVTGSDLSFPSGLTLVNWYPRNVSIAIVGKEEAP